ncbi:hypothetical protein [Frankia sp. Cj3]|uniref:hypothetical protein n=1 Tax=Frankia sp. Cj3 TaxID=2880976 RepID=UPI001EF65D6A|nr:hypothetical protein [Frankia sp. Cj3]
MPTSLRHLDHNREITPSSTFGLIIEVSEDVEISVFSAAEAVAGTALASLVTSTPTNGGTTSQEVLSIRTGEVRAAVTEIGGGDREAATAATDNTDDTDDADDEAAGYHGGNPPVSTRAKIQRSDD